MRLYLMPEHQLFPTRAAKLPASEGKKLGEMAKIVQ
jgi:hypothetical protein